MKDKDGLVYPLVIVNDSINYLALNKNQTATINSYGLNEYVDLSRLSQEELVMLYNDDKLILTNIITNICNTNAYTDAINRLNKKITAFTDEYDELIIRQTAILKNVRRTYNVR